MRTCGYPGRLVPGMKSGRFDGNRAQTSGVMFGPSFCGGALLPPRTERST